MRIPLLLVALMAATALADEAASDADKAPRDVEHSKYIADSPETGNSYVFDGKARPIALDTRIDLDDNPYSGMKTKRHKKSDKKPGKYRPGTKPKPAEESKPEENAKENPPWRKEAPTKDSNAQQPNRNLSPEPEDKEGGGESDSSQDAGTGGQEPKSNPNSGPQDSSSNSSPQSHGASGNLGDAMPDGEGSNVPQNP